MFHLTLYHLVFVFTCQSICDFPKSFWVLDPLPYLKWIHFSFVELNCWQPASACVLACILAFTSALWDVGYANLNRVKWPTMRVDSLCCWTTEFLNMFFCGPTLLSWSSLERWQRNGSYNHTFLWHFPLCHSHQLSTNPLATCQYLLQWHLARGPLVN